MEYGRCRIIEPWADWDYEIHADSDQIRRQGYAIKYPFTFEVNQLAQTARFSVESDQTYYQTVYTGTYEVPPFYDTSLSSCNCEDFQNRRLPCKHIYRLAVELRIIEIFSRPTFDKVTIDEIKASDDIDSHPEQVKHQVSGAKCKPLSIDCENKKGLFAGSGKAPYETALDSCTCRDFFVRKLPCKHMYRLRSELSTRERNDEH